MFYDECAHGWLDGLNRLFMEADDRCYKLHTARFMPLFSSKNFWELEKISSASQKREIGTHLEKKIKTIVQFSANP